MGLGEDGPDGLPPASRKALERAEIVMGAARHLSLLPEVAAKAVEWPVPFADGIPLLLSHRGRRVVMLSSGDPFWHGAGGALARHLDPSEWRCLPAPSALSLAAAALGWPLEQVVTMALHAAPFARMRPHLHPGTRALVTLRDGDAARELAHWLTSEGFGATTLHLCEALGGPRERLRHTAAEDFAVSDIHHPVIAGLEVAGGGTPVPLASGRPDALFEHDGQITKRPVRALTLSALAPLPGEHLWDIGGGSGSVAIEWLWSHPTTAATVIEKDPARAERIRTNAARLGADRLHLVTGAAPAALAGLDRPDAVFIGGGLSNALLEALWAQIPEGTRLVANAVTLEGEALLSRWQTIAGGDLLRIALSQAKPLGTKRGWGAAYPIVQWDVTR